MSPILDEALKILRANAQALRARGILHASVFGSVARGEARPDSDVDILVELEPGNPSGMFEYVRLQHDVSSLLGRSVDLVERKALKPLIRDEALKEAVDVF